MTTIKTINYKENDLDKIKKYFKDLQTDGEHATLSEVDAILESAQLCWPHSADRMTFIDTVLDFRSILTTLKGIS